MGQFGKLSFGWKVARNMAYMLVLLSIKDYHE